MDGDHSRHTSFHLAVLSTFRTLPERTILVAKVILAGVRIIPNPFHALRQAIRVLFER